jgi:hypothetical protein
MEYECILSDPGTVTKPFLALLEDPFQFSPESQRFEGIDDERQMHGLD